MKPTDTKIVNVYAPRNGGSLLTRVPFSGSVRKAKMTIAQIKQCLYAKMKVEEIVGEEVIPLDFTNYNKDNTGNSTDDAIIIDKAKKTISGTVINLDRNGNIIREPIVKKNNNAQTNNNSKPEIIVKNSSKKEFFKK